jgi:dihydrodipicolinate synthase/N-acetylneuraminate lyase
LARRPLVITATPTPFLEDGALDLVSARRLFETLAGTGVDAWFVAGSTGEFPALDDDERLALYRLALEVGGPERVIAHVGAASARQAARLLWAAADAGVRRFAAITPYYLPSDAAGTDAAIAEVRAAAGDLPLYLDLIPRLTGTTVTPAEAAAIVARHGLAGLKLSIPGTGFLEAVRGLVPETVELLSGEDRLLEEVAAAGGNGVVSGVSSACPGLFVDWAAAVAGPDADALAAVRGRAERAVDVIAPRISHAKVALEMLGTFRSATCRMAIAMPDDAERRAIRAVIA